MGSLRGSTISNVNAPCWRWSDAGSLAQEMWVFKADPADPAFTDWMAHGRKTAGDSPYTVYLTTPVSPEHSYRVYGNLGQATYLGFQLYRQAHGFNAPSGVLSQDDLVTDADGDFEDHPVARAAGTGRRTGCRWPTTTIC